QFIGEAVSRQQLSSATNGHQQLPSHLVGREEELARLQVRFDSACTGRRQLVFLSGEAGIGKTALVDHFLDRIQTQKLVRVGQGQCIEHYGVGEAYLPVLEALSRLGEKDDREWLVPVLRRVAPTWVGQLPTLVEETEGALVQRRAQGMPHGRMLRELADALD